MYRAVANAYSLVVYVLIFSLATAGCSRTVPIDPPPKSFLEEAQDYELAYWFRAGEVDDIPALEVVLQFEAGDTTSTDIRLPRDWAAVHDYYEGIVDVQMLTETAELDDTGDEHILRVEHEPNQTVVVAYRAVQTFETLDTYNRFRPVVDRDHFQALGYGIFVVPDVRKGITRSIWLDWSGLDDSWKVANTHGVHERSQVLDTDIYSLFHAKYLGGDYRFYEAGDAHAPIYVAFFGSWPYSKEKLVAQTENIIEGQYQFFDEPRDEPILVTVYPSDLDNRFQGSVYDNTVALWIGDNVESGGTSLLELISHEVFHFWNGGSIRMESPAKRYAWFSEGFTDFYASRLLLRQGLIDLSEYVDTRNRQLINYEFSPVRDATNDEIIDYFWSDYDMRRLAYLRGSLLALHWDAAIRADTDSSASLDTVMLTIRDRICEEEELRFSTDLMADVLSSVWADGLSDLDAIIEKGGYLAPHPDALGPCVGMEQLEVGPRNYGLDLEATTEAEELRGVEPDGPAYRAGLRDGQEYASYFMPGTEDGFVVQKAEVVIRKADGSEREITYLPTDEPRRVSRYVLDKERFEEEPDRCLEWFR